MRPSTPTCALVLLLVLACGQRPDEQQLSAPAPPPAAVLAPIRDNSTLDERLGRIEGELDAVLAAGLGAEGSGAALLRAEAVTDALLEAEPPFEWMSEDYLLQARLRQLQALADRIVAQLRRGAPEATVRADVRLLRENVAALRTAIDEGSGGPAPPPLDSLLAPARAHDE